MHLDYENFVISNLICMVIFLEFVHTKSTCFLAIIIKPSKQNVLMVNDPDEYQNGIAIGCHININYSQNPPTTH